MAILFVVAGVLVLVAGAEGLVQGASRLATGFGISPLVVGLTFVALGTSAPEVAVSVGASLGEQTELALGNVMGSNIFNILLTLGLTALLTPLAVSSRLVRLDVPLGIGAAVWVFLLAMDGSLGWGDGLVLLAGLAAYMMMLFYQAQTGLAADLGERPKTEISETPDWVRNGGLILGGLVLLVLGARWIVTGAVDIAQRLGVSELVIGLTIVAGGTSLPELATSVLAAVRGKREIAVGNVLGSNLLNLLAVLGLASLVAPGGVPVPEAVLWFDFPVMIAAAVACLPIFFTGQVVARWEGALFLGYYGAYTAYLFLAATQHDALSTFSTVMWMFVFPLTVVTLLGGSVRAWWNTTVE